MPFCHASATHSFLTSDVDRIAGELQAQDGLHNPYRKLSVLALGFPVLLHTIISIAAEHLHLLGHCSAKLAVTHHDRAIRSIRLGLAGRRSPSPLSSEDCISSSHGITADQALLAAILLQPAVIAYSGNAASSSQTHLDIAFYILNQLDYICTVKVMDFFIPRLLVQRFAIADLGTSIYYRRRPRMSLVGCWFSSSSKDDMIDKTQPSFREMTGCPHSVFVFLLRVMHLAADLSLSERPSRDVYCDAIALETDMRVHDAVVVRRSGGSSGTMKNKHMETICRAFIQIGLLLLCRRVFAESPSSPRVQHAMSTIFTLLDSIPVTTTDESSNGNLIRSGVDSASGLPFYLAAREAVTKEDQQWVTLKHKMWRKVYPNPARVQLMEVAEKIWLERDRGVHDIEQRCELVERGCEAYIF